MLHRTKQISILARSFHKTVHLEVKRKANPGIERRMGVLKDGNRPSVEDWEDDPENDPESDFFTANITHRQAEKEMEKYKEKLGHWVVRDKYFKHKSPNFLTWAEKEHIRHLHEEDPDQWTPEYISECFPIDIINVRKLLKAKWSPTDTKRLLKHDAAVKQNWELFRKGEFDDQLEYHMKKHLMKFKNRKVDLAAVPKLELKQKKVEMLPTKSNEFLNIITSCKTYNNQIESSTEDSKETCEQIEVKNEDQVMDTQLLLGKNIKTNKSMTLSELKRLLGEKDQGLAQAESIEVQLDSKENPSGTGVLSSTKASRQTLKTKVDSTELRMPPIKEFIRIPRRLYKKGATYKLQDCFYDDDGTLLYRVPGLTGQKSN